MKKSALILFFAIFIAKNTFSQWTVSGTNIFNSNTGYVGIANSSPGTTLDIGNVTKSTFAATNTDILGLQVRSTSNQTSAFKLGSFFYNSQSVANTAGISALNGYVLSSNPSGSVGTMNAIQATTEHSGIGTLTWDRAFFGSGLLTGSGIISNWASFYGGGVTITTGSTITNGYGLYLAAFPGGVTNKYGVYAVDANAMNYFAGKVTIGTGVTSTPAGYNMYVSGGILTEKVKAALATSSNWADYIFDKDYQLASLADVETFINKNKHLPGIPSADELVKDGGIDMNQMFAKQMEKIEELTLYIIQESKEIESMKARIVHLEQR